MAEATKTKAELLALYPDNSNNEISAMDLRDFVVSIGVYAELFQTATGTQDPDAAWEKLIFDDEGLSNEVIFGTSDFVIDNDGVYEVRIDLSAQMQNLRTFDLRIAVNGSVFYPLGSHEDGDSQIENISAGRLINLVVADVVEIQVQGSAATSNFFLHAGSRCLIKRIL